MERGWRRLLPALALFLFVQTIAPLRVVLPIEQTLLLLLPALAACAWVAWRRGGRIWLALGWTGAAIWVFSWPIAGDAAYLAFARGWTLVLAAVFGAVLLWQPSRPFFGRAIITLGVAGTVFVLLLAVFGSSAQRVERVVAGELADRVESSVQSMRARTTTADWAEVERSNPESARTLLNLMDSVEEQLRAMAPVGASIFPALLAFEALAALGLAWSLHHRLSRTRLGPPIAKLREFRFEDQSIWLFIVGLALVLVPRFVAWKGVGWSLLTFFGALYALRGLGVMTWFLVLPGRWGGVILVSLVAVLWPLWSLPLGIGLSDTYFDWRRRIRPSNQGSLK
jgi:hypothetical protein